MKKLAVNKKGIDTRTLSLIVVIPALTIIMLLFFVYLRSSAVERSEAVIKSELSYVSAREQVIEFLKGGKTPRWKTIWKQDVDNVERELQTFYRAPDPSLIQSEVSCSKLDNMLDCNVFLVLNIPLSELGLLNPLNTLFPYRVAAEFIREEFVNEVVLIPTPEGVVTFKIKGDRSI